MSYKVLYGSKLFHRATELPPNYRELALDKLVTEAEDKTKLPSTLTRVLLNSPVTYHDDDDSIHDVAAGIILALQESRHSRTHEWTEAMAVAMIAQRRFLEAAEYVTRLEVTAADEGRSMFLAAARFGWPPELGQQPFISPELGRRTFLDKQADLEKAFVGMAIRGDLRSMEDLYKKGIQGKAAASMAAMFGHAHVLDFLNRHELFPPNTHLLLSIATRNGQEKAVRFLLEIGCQPDLKNAEGESPFDIALGANEFAVLRILMDHSPLLGQLVTIESDRFACFFTCEDRDIEQRISLLHYFVSKGLMDIHGLDERGRSTIHHAVRGGHFRLIQAVMALGVNIHRHDITGQSPLELATNHYKFVSKGLAELTQLDPPFTRKQKRTFARTILDVQHQFMMGFCFDGDVITETLDEIERLWNAKDMDDKIVDIWIDNYSAAAMHDYIDKVLDTDLNGISKKMQSLILEAYWNTENAPYHKDMADATSSLPTARQVMTKLYPLFAQGRRNDNLAGVELHQLPIRDLHRIAAYCETPLGKTFCTGRQQAAQNEKYLLQWFMSTL